MIDTGASDIMLSISDAKKIGINTNNLIFNRPYQTANGRSFGASIKLKEVEISGIKFKDIYASVNEGDMGVALLGMSFLRRFSKYEFFQDRLVLTF
jgi:aspartyl protease family protein